jgi:hypothetical protein
LEEIIHLVGEILAPISPGLLFAVLVAGFIFGVVYVYKLNLVPEDIFHITMAGWVFIVGVFLYRFVTFFAGGPAPGFAGWLGIALLWAIYCVMMMIGSKILKKVVKSLRV